MKICDAAMKLSQVLKIFLFFNTSFYNPLDLNQKIMHIAFSIHITPYVLALRNNILIARALTSLKFNLFLPKKI